MVIEINKDIDRYQESVAMGLTAKQLIFSIASVVIGGGLVYLLYPFIGLTGAAYVAIPVVAPIALGGFYSYNGMSFYEVMGKKFHYMFGNRALTYVSTEGEPAIKAGNTFIPCVYDGKFTSVHDIWQGSGKKGEEPCKDDNDVSFLQLHIRYFMSEDKREKTYKKCNKSAYQ